jgi:hypothetical protein
MVFSYALLPYNTTYGKHRCFHGLDNSRRHFAEDYSYTHPIIVVTTLILIKDPASDSVRTVEIREQEIVCKPHALNSDLPGVEPRASPDLVKHADEPDNVARIPGQDYLASDCRRLNIHTSAASMFRLGDFR